MDFVEPNWIVSHSATSNDSYYTNGSLWGMYGDGSSPANQYGSQAAEAWGAGHVEVSTFYWTFTPKWISADGTRFTLIFTGKNTNDSWNSVAGRFRLQ